MGPMHIVDMLPFETAAYCDVQNSRPMLSFRMKSMHLLQAATYKTAYIYKPVCRLHVDDHHLDLPSSELLGKALLVCMQVSLAT